MNVKNGKDKLLISHPLPNIGRVMITRSPINSWKLVDWHSIRNVT